MSTIFAVLFYITLFLFILLKIYNCILIKKYNCKELYKKQKVEINKIKIVKVMKILLIIVVVIGILFIPYGITDFFLSLAFMIVDKGDKLNDSFNIMSVVLYTIYFIFIINKLYVNIFFNKFIRKQKNQE